MTPLFLSSLIFVRDSNLARASSQYIPPNHEYRVRSFLSSINLSSTARLCRTFANNAPELFTPNISLAIPAMRFDEAPEARSRLGRAADRPPELLSGGISWAVAS